VAEVNATVPCGGSLVHHPDDVGELVGAGDSGPVVDVVTGAKSTHVDVAVPVEEHDGAGLVLELVHDVEVLHLVDVHGDERRDRPDPLGRGGHDGVEACAVVMAAAAEPAAALALAVDGVVHCLRPVQVLDVVRGHCGGGGGIERASKQWNSFTKYYHTRCWCTTTRRPVGLF